MSAVFETNKVFLEATFKKQDIKVQPLLSTKDTQRKARKGWKALKGEGQPLGFARQRKSGILVDSLGVTF